MGRLTRRVAVVACCSALTCLGGVLAGSAAQESPVGRWTTLDEKTGKVVSEVEVYEKDGKLFGKIVKLLEPNAPRVCSRCSGADRDRPIVGLVILRDLVLKGRRYRGGTVLDPEEGKVYKAEIWVEEGRLKVRGKFAMFHETRTWIKAE